MDNSFFECFIQVYFQVSKREYKLEYIKISRWSVYIYNINPLGKSLLSNKTSHSAWFCIKATVTLRYCSYNWSPSMKKHRELAVIMFYRNWELWEIKILISIREWTYSNPDYSQKISSPLRTQSTRRKYQNKKANFKILWPKNHNSIITLSHLLRRSVSKARRTQRHLR